jgi:hypothetical protein
VGASTSHGLLQGQLYLFYNDGYMWKSIKIISETLKEVADKQFSAELRNTGVKRIANALRKKLT